uniref:helix-turn-helix domain-containing protein n=1 Tax=Pararhizobium sp. IMCC3301 TaxID=3067904 RepID=UPI002740AA94|nr:LysR family transcriptional regulator [Pararhizobium sp. IMCC3301]
MNNLRRLKLRHLETFVEVARQISISCTAGRLHLSRTAMTRTIRKLQAIICKPLIENTVGTSLKPYRIPSDAPFCAAATPSSRALTGVRQPD